MPAGEGGDLLARVAEYLRAHHTMVIATSDPVTNEPHAAHVFYAADDELRLVFLSRPTSVHGEHIGAGAEVAVTVSEEYEDWRLIKGVQLWGRAELLSGIAKAGAIALFLRRFPFLQDFITDSKLSERLRGIGVYRFEPKRAGLTDNTSGVFGRETLDLVGE